MYKIPNRSFMIALFFGEGECLSCQSRDSLSQSVVETLNITGQSCLFGVTYSPDGNTIATASDDKTVKLWVLLQEV